MMKRLLMSCTILCAGHFALAQASTIATAKSEADAYWATMPRFLNTNYITDSNGTQLSGNVMIGPSVNTITSPSDKKQLLEYKKSRIQRDIYEEMYKRTLRDWGTGFWTRYPNDPRKFKWLLLTCTNEPAYWADLVKGAEAQAAQRFVAPLDTAARRAWQQRFAQYSLEMRKAPGVEDFARMIIEGKEFITGLQHLKWRDSDKDKFDIDGFVKRAVDYAGKGNNAASITDMLRVVYRDKKDFGLNDGDILRFAGLLKKTAIPEFIRTGEGFEKILKLKKQPLQFSARSMDGKMVSVKDYRGKLLLVDFWSLTCSFCIEKMPEIKGVYEKYKSKGFEVLSVCLFNNNKFQKDEYQRIKAIHDRVGGSWQLILLPSNAGEQGAKLFDNYGFSGVPQFILLDKEGKLLQYQGDMLFRKGALEQIAKLYLEDVQ